MELLVKTFHIDWRLLIAQIVNFAIVLAALYFFAWKPILKVLNDRSTKIEKSLVDAKKVEENLINTEKDYKEAVVKAKKEAQAIVEESRLQGEKIKTELAQKAKSEVVKIIAESKQQIANEKEKMIAESKAEIVDLVVLTVEKVLNKKIDVKVNQDLIKESIKEIK